MGKSTSCWEDSSFCHFSSPEPWQIVVIAKLLLVPFTKASRPQLSKTRLPNWLEVSWTVPNPKLEYLTDSTFALLNLLWLLDFWNKLSFLKRKLNPYAITFLELVTGNGFLKLALKTWELRCLSNLVTKMNNAMLLKNSLTFTMTWEPHSEKLMSKISLSLFKKFLESLAIMVLPMYAIWSV